MNARKNPDQCSACLHLWKTIGQRGLFERADLIGHSAPAVAAERDLAAEPGAPVDWLLAGLWAWPVARLAGVESCAM